VTKENYNLCNKVKAKKKEKENHKYCEVFTIKEGIKALKGTTNKKS